jgi:hypothetical protein
LREHPDGAGVTRFAVDATRLRHESGKDFQMIEARRFGTPPARRCGRETD